MAKLLFGSLPKTDAADSEDRDDSGSSTHFTVFLDELGLSQYAEAFEDFGIESIDQARDLHAPMLTMVGLNSSEAKKLKQALEAHGKKGDPYANSDHKATSRTELVLPKSTGKIQEVKTEASAQGTATKNAPSMDASRLVMRRRMVALYSAHNPAKVDEVDGFLDKYAGKYDLMWAKISGKYGAEAAADAVAAADREEEEKEEEKDLNPNAESAVEGKIETRPCFIESYAEEKEIHRGLTNKAGQNNCFLNASVQALAHLPTFQTSFVDFNPSSSGAGELVLPLHNLLEELSDGKTNALSADVLREALALLFAPKGMFQLGEVDDAAECFESIIEHVHCAACGISEAEGGRDQSCGYPPCPSCAQFKMSFFDQASCTECSATGEPSFEDQFIYRVYVDEVLKAPAKVAFSTILRRAADNESASRALALATSRDSGGGRVNRMGSFAQAAKMPSATMPCPGALEGAGCLKGKRIEQRKCVQAPPILVMSLVWSTNEPSKEDIKKLMSGFGSSLDLSKVFEFADDNGQQHRYRLSGMICYYGKHYISLVARRLSETSEHRGEFICFDDDKLQVLESWEAAQDYCSKSRYQPTLVWYEEIPSGEPPWWHDEPTVDEETFAPPAPEPLRSSVKLPPGAMGLGMLSFEGTKPLKKVQKEVEHRFDGEEGPFTKEEFYEVYGGYAEWEAADPKRKYQWNDVQLRHVEEQRYDGDEGPFTKEEFFEVYGGYSEWEAAKRLPIVDSKMEAVALKATPVEDVKSKKSNRTSVSFEPATQPKAKSLAAKPSAKKKAVEEKRIDESDGGAYTRAEFLEVYGDDEVWEISPPYLQPGQEAERRIDANDGGKYTKAQFFECYGNYEAWNASAQTTKQGKLTLKERLAGGQKNDSEKRVDPTDGGSYTKEEFYQVYGNHDVWKISKVETSKGQETLGATKSTVAPAPITTSTVKLKAGTPAWKLAQEEERARKKGSAAPAPKKAIVKKPPMFKEGQKIEGRFGGRAKYFPGKITKVFEDALTYDIAYDDGDVETMVKEVLIRKPLKKPPGSSKAKSSHASSAPEPPRPVKRAESPRPGDWKTNPSAAPLNRLKPKAKTNPEVGDEKPAEESNDHNDDDNDEDDAEDEDEGVATSTSDNSSKRFFGVKKGSCISYLSSKEYWAWQDEQRRSAAKARTEAAMAKRREQRLAQEAKLAAVGVKIPTAQEAADRVLRRHNEAREKAAVAVQCSWRCKKARAFIQTTLDAFYVAKAELEAREAAIHALAVARAAAAAEAAQREAEKEAKEAAEQAAAAEALEASKNAGVRRAQARAKEAAAAAAEAERLRVDAQRQVTATASAVTRAEAAAAEAAAAATRVKEREIDGVAQDEAEDARAKAHTSQLEANIQASEIALSGNTALNLDGPVDTFLVTQDFLPDVAAAVSTFVLHEFEATVASDLGLLDPEDLLAVVNAVNLKKVSAAKLTSAWRVVLEHTPGSAQHQAKLAGPREALEAWLREADAAALQRQQEAQARQLDTVDREAAATEALVEVQKAKARAAAAVEDAEHANRNADALAKASAEAEVEVTEAVAARDAADAPDEAFTNTATPILDALMEVDESEKREYGDEHALLDLDDETIKDHASLGNDSESDQGSQENPPTESKVQWSDEEDD